MSITENQIKPFMVKTLAFQMYGMLTGKLLTKASPKTMRKYLRGARAALTTTVNIALVEGSAQTGRAVRERPRGFWLAEGEGRENDFDGDQFPALMLMLRYPWEGLPTWGARKPRVTQ